MQPTLSEVLIQREKIKASIWSDAVLVILGSVLLAVSAQLSFYLPISPIPITGQTLAVLLCGAVLGSRRGMASMGLYILQGLAGLPVFAGGQGGLGVLFGPTAGYLVGFIAAAYIAGLLAEKGFDRKWHTTIAAFLAGQMVIYFFGVLRLTSFVGLEQALKIGVFPFLIGDAIKAGIAAALLPSAWLMIDQFKKF